MMLKRSRVTLALTLLALGLALLALFAGPAIAAPFEGLVGDGAAFNRSEAIQAALLGVAGLLAIALMEHSDKSA